jgi:excisionase family DNA binding protein
MNISRDSIITLIGNGEITAYKVGNRWRIPYREYEIYTARHSNIKGYVYTLGDKVV